MLAELDLIDGADDFASFNPADWIANRRIGTATVRGVFADIYANAWVSLLRRELAAEALRLGVKEIDASTLQANGPRRLTQAASLRVRLRGLNGVYYRSRFGHSMENCALFEPWDFDAHESEEIALDDADMWTILERFAIATQGR